jgi:hypothetical protein
MRPLPLHKVPNAASAFGLLLAVAGGLLAWRLGDISGADSLMIGLLGTVLTLQFELLLRHEQHSRFAQLLTGPRWLVDPVRSIAVDAERILQDFRDTPVEQEAAKFLAECAAEFDNLRLGRLRRSADDVTYLIQHTRQATRSLLAVTNIGSGIGNPRWWEEEKGRAYWQANRDMAGRIEIRRVFIHSAEQRDKAVALARLQQSAGVGVRLVPADRVRSEHRLNFAVWDDSIVWEAQMNAAGAPIANLFSVGRSDVDRLTRIFSILWINSTGLDDAPADGQPAPGGLRSVDEVG